MVTGSGTDSTAVLDGFTVTLGYADQDPATTHGLGGGIYNNTGSPTLSNLIILSNTAIDNGGGGIFNGYNSSPVLTDVLIENNSSSNGGGMYNYSSSSPVLNSVTFAGNFATGSGGGLCCTNGCSPKLTNVIFNNNMTFIGNGGGMANIEVCDPVLVNVVFVENTSGMNGGGMANYYGSRPTLINTTFTMNSSNLSGGGIYNSDSHPTIINSILGGNFDSGSCFEIFNEMSFPEISFSLILDCGGSGAGWDTDLGMDLGFNLDGDPCFVAHPVDLRLLPYSPAINAGDNASVPADVATDLDGNPRIAEGTVDMGAYEYQAALAVAFPSPIVFEGVPMNEATCDTIYYANNGSITCTIEGIYGCSTAPFSIDTTMTVHTLAPGGTTAVVVCVFPTSAEPDTAEVTIVSDAWNSPTVIQVRLEGVTSTDAEGRMPQPFRIVSVSPNPFNPSTTVRFTLPEAMPVTAAVYSVTGARIRVLESGSRFSPGENRITWDGRTDRGTTAASGVYFIRVKTKLGAKVARAVLLR